MPAIRSPTCASMRAHRGHSLGHLVNFGGISLERPFASLGRHHRPVLAPDEPRCERQPTCPVCSARTCDPSTHSGSGKMRSASASVNWSFVITRQVSQPPLPICFDRGGQQHLIKAGAAQDHTPQAVGSTEGLATSSRTEVATFRLRAGDFVACLEGLRLESATHCSVDPEALFALVIQPPPSFTVR